jgi:hypothetical protein
MYVNTYHGIAKIIGFRDPTCRAEGIRLKHITGAYADWDYNHWLIDTIFYVMELTELDRLIYDIKD